MTREEAFANLRNILAELYPGEASTRRVVSDAGLDDERIAFAGTAVDTWHSILREAEKSGKIQDLLEVVLREYGGNQKLVQAIDAYRRQSKNTSTIEPPQPDTSQLQPKEEKGYKWWLRYVVVPIISGGGLVALIIALLPIFTGGGGAPTSTPTPPSPMEEVPPIATPNPTPTEPAAGSTWTNPRDGVVYVYVPAGPFVMGSSDDDIEQAQTVCTEAGFTCERPWFANEQPPHRVVLDGFWVMQTEVTNAQYARCVQAGACTAPDNVRWKNAAYADHPVTDVDWAQASAYADWVGGRLPTEAEWEKAARGTDGRIYPWGDRAPDDTLTNYGLQVGDTTPVGSYPAGASPYGALDMAGNVMEWVADWYDSSYYANSPETKPEGPTSGMRRVVRGGGFNYRGNNVRAARRGGTTPSARDNNVGFRLVSAGFDPMSSGGAGF